MARKEPLGDLLFDLVNEVKGDGEFYLEEGCADLVEKALACAKALEQGIKADVIPVSSPSVLRNLGSTKRRLKKLLEEHYADYDDEDVDVDLGKKAKRPAAAAAAGDDEDGEDDDR